MKSICVCCGSVDQVSPQYLEAARQIGAAEDAIFKEGGQIGVLVRTFDISGADVEFYWISALVP